MNTQQNDNPDERAAFEALRAEVASLDVPNSFGSKWVEGWRIALKQALEAVDKHAALAARTQPLAPADEPPNVFTPPPHPESQVMKWSALELSAIRAYGQRCWAAGNNCERVAPPDEPTAVAPTPAAPSAGSALSVFDEAVAVELSRVSHVHYDSHEICKHFAGELRKRLATPAAPSAEPVYWQWRRKGQQWDNTQVFDIEVFATTDDSEVRMLYATPAVAPAAQRERAPETAEPPALTDERGAFTQWAMSPGGLLKNHDAAWAGWRARATLSTESAVPQEGVKP